MSSYILGHRKKLRHFVQDQGLKGYNSYQYKYNLELFLDILLGCRYEEVFL